VILYELIAGVGPHQARQSALAGIVKVVGQTDAPAPKLLVRALDVAVDQTIAEARG